MQDIQTKENEIKYHNIDSSNSIIHGLLWNTENYNRLQTSERVNENLTLLSRHTSGVSISFKTNSTNLKLKCQTTSDIYMSHMSGVSQIGFDLYLKVNNKYLHLAVAKPLASPYNITLFKDFNNEMKEFILYCPLYSGIKSLLLGVDENSILESSLPINKDKIVFYGTSITQGGCASRPGMNISAILNRMLNNRYETYNLGFSGNGHCNIQIAEALSKIENIKYLIIEVEGNNYEKLYERLEPFIEILRTNLPKTKIILQSHFPYIYHLIDDDKKIQNEKLREFQQTISKKYKLIFINGYDILNEYNYEAYVDNIHLSDIGFYYWAKYLIDRKVIS